MMLARPAIQGTAARSDRSALGRVLDAASASHTLWLAALVTVYVAFVLGIGCLTCLSGMWLCNRIWGEATFGPLQGRPLMTYSATALLLGAQMMALGFLAELITAGMHRHEDSFSIAEKTPAPTEDERPATWRQSA